MGLFCILIDIVMLLEYAEETPLTRYQKVDSTTLSGLKFGKLDEFRYGVIPFFEAPVLEYAILKSVDSMREQKFVNEQYSFLLCYHVFRVNRFVRPLIKRNIFAFSEFVKFLGESYLVFDHNVKRQLGESDHL